MHFIETHIVGIRTIASTVIEQRVQNSTDEISDLGYTNIY